MNIIILDGSNLANDKDNILDNLKIEDNVFVYRGTGHLCDYIDALGLSNKNLFKLRICQEVGNINIYYECKGKRENYDKLSDLLSIIDINIPAKVVVCGDVNADESTITRVRNQLSNIVQQFIYLNLPLDKIQVMTEKECKNYDKIMRFSEGIDQHIKNIQVSREKMNAVRKTEYFKIVNEVNEALDHISGYLEDAQNNELKIAMAASKKSGKSVIVNSIIGCELAPTSSELATPNNCIYRESKEGYVLETEGHKKTFPSDRDMRSYLLERFKEAEKKEGLGIPDMNIGYVPLKSGLSSYTIYDTPGPDLAGATDHKKAAYDAIDKTDVIVFPIDYSKYLTTGEVAYLKDIKELFRKKQKRYSLILCVNKLDCRYTNKGDKSTVRILDFIKNKLIQTAPEFSDAIVIGTSALMYFDCIEAEKISGSEIFQNNNENFSSDLDKFIEKIEDDDNTDVDVLQFINVMTSNIRHFDGIKIQNLDMLKRHSGMPNLLGYIRYIAENKARAEKIDNIMHHIDQEYGKIQNLFHFQKLEEEMAQNQELLEQASKALQTFGNDIVKIYDETYQDIGEMREADELKSETLKEVGKFRRINFDMISKTVTDEFVDGMLKYDNIEEDVLDDEKCCYQREIERKFRESNVVRYIDGKDRKVITAKDLQNVIKYIVDDLEKTIPGKVEENTGNLAQKLKEEFDKIMNDLEALICNRATRLKDAVTTCEKSLREECGIEFEIVLPEFQFEFRRKQNETGKMLVIDKKGLIEKLNKVISNEIDPKRDIKDNLFEDIKNNLADTLFGSIIRSLGGKLGTGEDFNKISYDKGYINQLYDDSIKMDIANCLGNSGIKGSLEEIKKNFKDEIIDYTKKLEKEMQKQQEHAESYQKSVSGVINHSEEYHHNIEKLQNKQNILEEIEKCVRDFCKEWKLVREYDVKQEV